MKLRIKANSVRVRLTQTEVARLAAGERIEQVTEFSSESRLISSIESVAPLTAPQVVYENHRVALLLPTGSVKQWATSDQISIEAEQQMKGGHCLKLLIEKDFECLHSRLEVDMDAYPNPMRQLT